MLLPQDAIPGKGFLDRFAQQPLGLAIGSRHRRVVRFPVGRNPLGKIPHDEVAGVPGKTASSLKAIIDFTLAHGDWDSSGLQ
jgi:hypothetical protein